MRWVSPESREGNAIVIPEQWLRLQYYDAFNVLFRVENALRVLVYVVLKRQFGDKWAGISISSEEGETSIGAIAARRRTQAATFGYLGYPVSSALMYLTTGELLRIITADSYWKLFREFFPGAKKVTEIKFEEISAVRNDLAHFRPIKPDDVETAKQSSKHILPAVEMQLHELIVCPDTVPTNTEAEWYHSLRALGTGVCQLKFRQSRREDWVRVDVRYQSPILSHRKFGARFNAYTLLTVDAPPILKDEGELTAAIICCSEQLDATTVGLNGVIAPAKSLSFAFSRSTLEREHELVRRALERIISTISTETELIEQDNLARGKYTREPLKKSPAFLASRNPNR